MEDNPNDAVPIEQERREAPPLLGAPLLTAVMVFLVLPLLTLVVLLLMWLFD
jgi:hypothetical protein